MSRSELDGDPVHVLLMPGQWYFGSGAHTLRTLLGSCVGITLWHPRRHVGGMCHYLLPCRLSAAPKDRTTLDGRYGDEAITLLAQAVRTCDSDAGDYEVHLYGGADTFPDLPGTSLDIGARNIEIGWRQLERHGFQVGTIDVGDHVSRVVTLDLRGGEVGMKRGQRP